MIGTPPMTPNSSGPMKFDEWLWSLPDGALDDFSLRDLAREASQDGVEVPQLTFLTVIAEDVDPFAGLRRSPGVRERREGRRLSMLKVGPEGRSYVVGVVPAGPGVAQLFGTPPHTDSRWRRVEETWMKQAAPRLGKVILNRADFESLGDALAEHGRVEVARMTARVLRDKSSYSRGWPSDDQMSRLTHREALSETGGMIVRTLTLHVGTATQLHLRREAGASFYRGEFRLFADVVLGRLASAAKERLDLLRGKQREPDELPSSMISMRLSDLDLDESAVREELFNAISGVHGMQAAVLHENPYLHVLVTDFLNGASYDVIVTDAKRIDIFPGLTSAAGSLARLTDVLGIDLGMDDLSLRQAGSPVGEKELLASF